MQKTANCGRTSRAANARSHRLNQTLRIMRLSGFILLLICLHFSAVSASQSITLSGRHMTVRQILAAVEKQTGYNVWGTSDFLKRSRQMNINVQNMPLATFLEMVTRSQPFTYKLVNKTIVLSEKQVMSSEPDSTQHEIVYNITISGRVLNAETKEGIQAASVTVKQHAGGASSDSSGFFQLEDVPENATLVITSVGYAKMEVSLSVIAKLRTAEKLTQGAGYIIKNTSGAIDIYLEPAKPVLDEVVINTGISKRDKNSFTGAAAVYTGEQLKTIGNRNILESLRSLDPAFIKIENNLQGSNPNATANFEIRGQTSVNINSLNDQFRNDPNQPLFILDGFEATIQAISDLDMNRVASITILKDAASTALYGSKAANGVIVVETKRPVGGKLQLNYISDLTIEMPDLSSFNLMNGAEKLEYEFLQGALYAQGGNFQWNNELRYNARLAEVKRGVNTYWISEPVRTGVSQRHSLQMTGGSNELIFNLAASYGNQLGVMKGSGRETWGGNIGITYRKGNLNINNLLSLSGAKGTESPYGSFSTYANAIPYYRKRNEDGSIPKYLDPVFDPSIVNPLYNASLGGINEKKDFTFFNNLSAVYTLSRTLRIQAGLQVMSGGSTAVRFIPPDHSQFDNVELRQKGSYTNTRNENNSYSSNLMLSYGETIGKSRVSASVRGDLRSLNGTLIGLSAVGFPYGTDGNPLYAYSYAPSSAPTAGNTRTRSAGVLASMNYAWDRRFLIDAVYRIDGASVFGTNHTFKPFLSGGLGWNLHEEKQLRGSRFINLLKLRANAGFTGNENLGQFSSISIYNYQTGSNNNFGQGITLSSLGNPSLDWQKTLQLSYGLDFSIWDNRVSGYLEYFDKRTDPLVISAEGTLPASTGTGSNFVMNIGELHTKGLNFNVRVLPVNNVAKRIIWSVGVMGSNYFSEFQGLGNSLAKLNESQTSNKGLQRYLDGYSPQDLWAVVSKGVDPASGQELFLKKDGTLTFTYSTDDIVKVGNSRPTIEGGINTSFTYKEFTFGAVMRYRMGGYVFNNALYSKVENIGILERRNVDRRALYDRWQQPGDLTQFTAISSRSSNLSSRFIQKDSHLVGESINMSWRSAAPWVKQLRLQMITVTGYLNDIFRLEKIRSERGIEYPYARTAGLSVNLSF